MASPIDLPPTIFCNAIPDIPTAWFRGRRWFSSKGRTIESITVSDWGSLALEQPAIMALALVRYNTGNDEHYCLPLVASQETHPVGVQTPPSLAIEYAGTTWYLHDAFQFASYQRLLIECLLAGDTLPMEHGQLIFRPEQALTQAPPPLTTVRLVTAEQSNSSIIYDHMAILKCFRRVVAGINPDVEVSRFLTTRAGFSHTPAMLGSISYVSTNGVEHSLGLLQAFVPNDGDAWEYVQTELDDFLTAAMQRPQPSNGQLPHEVHQLASSVLGEIHELGALTGQMHLAFASDPRDPEFAPRPLTAEQVSAWQYSIGAECETMLNELALRALELPEEQRETVAALLVARPQITRRIAQLTALSTAGVVTTRFHGDYHLGQVLVSHQGFLILDFEGEPLRTLAERRAHGSPLKDVAGMLRSLSYAAAAALIAAERRMAVPNEAERRRLIAWASAWEQAAREEFRAAYIVATRGAAFVPQEPELRDATIAAFELEKAMYELNYELNNRPDWLPIPLRGILRVIEH